MGRKTFVVNWLWMALAFVYLKTTNSTTNLTHHNNQLPANYDFITNSTTTRSLDSETNGSERNRRLIPFMAFYLPPTELPINQQYATQGQRYTNSTEQHVPPRVVESAGPLPPPGYIAVPFLQMKTTNGATYDRASLQQQLQQQQQQQIQTRYRPIIYNTNSYHLQMPSNGHQPLLHLSAPGPTGNAASLGVPILRANKPKSASIQHFPPLENVEQQQKQHEQPILYRQRPQQHQYNHQTSQKTFPKNNLTPFTPSNTLPGHFVPIIYTPIHGGGPFNDKLTTNNNHQNSKTINSNYNNNNNNDNDNKNEAPDKLSSNAKQMIFQYQQQEYSNSYASPPSSATPLFQQQQQISDTEFISSSDTSSFNDASQFLQQQQQKQYQPQQQQQIKFVEIGGLTGSGNGITSTQQGPVYHIIKETSPSPLSPSTSPQQNQPLITLKSHHQPPISKHTHIQSSKSGNFFEANNEQQQQLQQEQQQQSFHEQYFHTNELTPQEKYVMYLRQRMRYEKQKQNGQNSKDRKLQQQQQYLVQQPTPISTPTNGLNENIGFVYSTMAASPPESENQNYPQHSPVGHAVYLSPELQVPANHQPTPLPSHSHSIPSSTKSPQQVLHIPVQSFLSEIDSFQKTLQPAMTKTTMNSKRLQQHHQIRYATLIQQGKHYSSNSLASQYADENIVEEPKQYLDEEEYTPQQQYSTESPLKQPATPSQAAFIIVTTAAPTHHQNMDSAVAPQAYQPHSTLRPVYQNMPTLRLQPITTPSAKYSPYATKRPSTPNYILSSTAPSSTLTQENSKTEYYGIKYVSTTPSYHHVMTSPKPLQPIRLKPSFKYETSTPKNYESNDEIHSQIPYTHQPQQELPPLEDPNQLPDIRTSSLADILHKLQASNHLPQTLTPDNIDNSIKTLITILNNLKQTQTIVANPSQHHEQPPASSPDYDYSNGNEDVIEHQNDNLENDFKKLQPSDPNKHPGPSTGRAGIDYPNYAEIPQTSFDCSQQRYKGFFGDPETNCQVWHYCDLNGGKASFLCPNGTIFSQIALTCDWWFNVKCSTTSQLYVLNERLYKYILPFTPKFPEDYSGPIVDKYLAMKFKEMEEKMRLEKEKTKAIKAEQTENHIEESSSSSSSSSTTTTTTSNNKIKSDKHRLQIDEQSSEKNLLTDDISDDLAQKGSFDTFESSTKQIKTTTTSSESEEIEPLSVRPIVVSASTVEQKTNDNELTTEYDNRLEAPIDDQQENSEHYNHQQQQRSPTVTIEQRDNDLIIENNNNNGNQKQQQQRESTKISVEKVEVIEIKSDGNSGHLTPEMIYRNTSKKR